MDRKQLDQRNTATIRRHWRTLTDNGGQPPQQLLDDLAATAIQHAADMTTPPSMPILPPSETIPVKTEHAAAPAKTAPRRTTPRRTAK
ncbi:MAG TPA: hypothetical protein VME40_07455 [Caulobacteraceae bacterium]|nr:hypothetical protein [Caulobacteraceae bacterium]